MKKSIWFKTQGNTKKGSIVKLIEISWLGRNHEEYIVTGRYIIFKSGECEKFKKENKHFISYCHGNKLGFTNEYIYYFNYNKLTNDRYDDGSWYDNFCWDYINKKQTYLIEIAEILEVK